jgi:predicted MFS family arabinose efflux permease
MWLPPMCFELGTIGFGVLSSLLERARSRRGSDPGGARVVLFTIAMAIALLIVAVPVFSGPWGGIGMVGVAVFGAGGLMTLLTSDLLSRVPRARAAAAAGFVSASLSLGFILANPLIGVLVDATGGYTLSFAAMGLWLLVGTILWLGWSRSRGVPSAITNR